MVNELARGPQRFALLASALAGRTVAVAAAGRGEPSWTDGATVFVDTAAAVAAQLETVAVQASLLAGGGLAPAAVRPLVRRNELARRYLAVEGQRALAANEDLLPAAVRSIIDHDLAACTDSPAASLALAKDRRGIAGPPDSFGVIRARSLLARPAESAAHLPRRDAGRELADLDADGDADDAEDVQDPFSSPVGGGGMAGKLLQRLLSQVRRIGGAGAPGADTPTRRSRSGNRGAGAVSSAAAPPTLEVGDGVRDRRFRYPEWDAHRRCYRPDWCTVQELEPTELAAHPMARPDVHALRRPLTRLGIGLDRCHRQPQGDDIDVDAAVQARVEALSGSAPDDAVYLDNLRRRRDLAVLVLLDVSGSAGEPGTVGRTVHEQQRSVAAALTVALHDLGDRLALYGFASQGRTAVHLIPVKRFDDRLDAAALRRLNSLTPGAYSRLGAAIRHGAAVIAEQAGTSRRLLVVISDGLAYDHGYERAYGAADARRALAEARRAGIGCLCLTVGAGTEHAELARVFGSAAHASIAKPTQLAGVIGPLLRAALRTADLRRRVTRTREGHR